MPANPVPALRKLAIAAIREHVDPLGLTQAELAKRLGIPRPRVSLLLSGKADAFSLDALTRIATRAGLKVGLTFTRPWTPRG